MGYNLKKFGSGTMDKGVTPRTMDFNAEPDLDFDSYNVSQGMQQGLGPRNGCAPIPGHADNETTTLNPRLPGLMMSEGSPASGFSGRRKVLGWVQLSLPSPSDITQKITVYGAAVTAFSGSVEYLDIVLCSTGTTVESLSTFIYDGFGTASYGLMASTPNNFSFLAEGVVTNAGVKTATLPTYLTFDSSIYSASVAAINVTGPDIGMGWLLGACTAIGDATHAPSASFFRSLNYYPEGGTTQKTIVGGIPSEYQLQNFKIAARSMKVIGLTVDAQFNISYSAVVTPSSTTFKKDLLEGGTVNLDVAAITATKDTAGTTYSANASVLVNDPAASSNASYSAVAVAAKKPYICLFQGPFRTAEGKHNQWFDLTQNVWQPPIVNSTYTEDGITKSTCFARWPPFATGFASSGTIPASPEGITLLGANTGVMRKATAYEFTYSIYNKRLNFESNVGTAVKYGTGTDDFVALQFWNGNAAAGAPINAYYKWRQNAAADHGTQHIMPFHFGDFQDDLTKWYNPLLALNFTEYRFYYRQLGTFEWLPAGNIDAAQYWFDGNLSFNLCTGTVSGTPGGQPGGFNDYSPLPTDQYNCVVQYKNRLFWFSDTACVFSLSNNVFAYAARNSISASTGKFLGGIVHNYPGQAEQSSRLIIFGSDSIYVARFSGVRDQTTVQISADAAGNYDVEGSDLIIDPWTNSTAFSYKAAAIADGILYYWGPKGVFRDDGVATPTKISDEQEPNIFTLYDPNLVGDIHAHYDDLTREITWFYTPKTVDAYATHMLVYNVRSQTFLLSKTVGKIDWAQSLTVESNIGTAGKRTMIGARSSSSATTQRSYFYDNRCRSGDNYPTTDWMIKTISTPSSGVRRLTLAAGYDATNFARILVGDRIALQQTQDYDPSLTSADKMIAEVVAVGAGTVDIALPNGAALDEAASPTFSKYFPFWQSSAASVGLNGFPYQMKTVYWTPAGINGYFFWLFWYLMAKLTLWKSDLSLGWDLSYRTPTADGLVTDAVAFADNSDGNFQLYHPLRPGNDNHEGQSLRLVVSGTHIGHEWVLQYMEIHGTPIAGDPLKRFEG